MSKLFGFVLQKIKSKKWLILSLFVGNVLLIGIVASNFIYSQAVLQNALETELSDYLEENNVYPGTVTLTTTVSDDSLDEMEDYEYIQSSIKELGIESGVSSLDIITEIQMMELKLDLGNNDTYTKNITLSSLSDLESHVEIISGEMYSNELEADGSIGVIVSEATLIKKDLIVGESYCITNLYDDSDDNYYVTIKGVFENNSDSDIYWVSSPSDYNMHLFVEETLFETLFMEETASRNLSVKVMNQLDYMEMKTQKVETLVQEGTLYENEIDKMKDIYYTNNYQEILVDHMDEMERLNVTLLVLQVPIFVLLGAFIFMVSKQILELEQAEISIFKSRGASKKQILGIYSIQSVIICTLSFIIGIPFGYVICQVLGASNAFLEFVNRTNLPATINVDAIRYSMLAAGFSIITMVAPVFKYANVGIVMAKRKKQQKLNMKWWEKIGVDFICIGISLYGLYTVNSQKAYIVEQISYGESVDPTMFLYSSLFIIGIGLFALRIFPWIIQLIFTIGKRKWSPATYASFKKVISRSHNQGFIMIFLIMTISLGIFSAVTARTINTNAENNISYTNGAQIILQEVWQSNDTEVSEDTTGTVDLVYTEPNYEKYMEVEGVESYTKVLVNDNITASFNGETNQSVTLMGIETKKFGETAWFDEGLLYYHWYQYLNAISQQANAVLVSSNAQEAFGLEVGDAISYYDNTLRKTVRGTIFAFVDYWPTYNSVTLTQAADNTFIEVNQYLIVANLSHIQSTMGVTPYEIWMKMEDTTQPIYNFAQENDIQYEVFEDTAVDLIEQKSDPIFQGTNGILTVGFITVLVLCMVGFLIYWILSIISRQLQFGIFRAMGMSMHEVIFMLVNEQLCVSGYSILMGTGIGILASILYVPIIGITYSASDQALPLDIVLYMGDLAKIFIVIGIMIGICMFVLYTMIAKLKITQVLKLGED